MANVTKGCIIESKFAVLFILLCNLSQTDYAGAELRMEPSGVKILRQGENFTFVCAAPGESTQINTEPHLFVPSVFHGGSNNRELLVDIKIGNGSTIYNMKMINMEMARIGRYSCDVPDTGENVSLVLLTPMAFTYPSGVKVVQPGETIGLACEAATYSSLEASFERDTTWTNFWGKEYGQEKSSRRSVSFDSLESSLVIHTTFEKVIRKAEYKDMGRYVCESKDSLNKDNYVRDYVDLIVLDAMCSEDVYPSIGGLISLSCWVQEVAQYIQHVTWYHDSKLLNSTAKLPGVIMAGEVLMIPNATESNSGHYRCVVSVTIHGKDYQAAPKEIFVGVGLPRPNAASGLCYTIWRYVVSTVLIARFILEIGP